MLELITVLVSIFVSFAEVYMIFMLFDTFYERRLNHSAIYFFSGMAYIAVLWIFGRIDIVILKLFVAVISVAIITLILYSGEIRSRIMHLFTYFLVLVSCDLLVYYTANYFVIKSPYGVAADEAGNIPLAIISKLFQFTICSIIIRAGQQREERLLAKDFMALMFVSAISLMTAIVLCFHSAMLLNTRIILNIFAAIGLLLLNFAIYYLFSRSKRLAVTEKEKELLEQRRAFEVEKFSEIEKLQQNIDILRHDMRHHIGAMQSMMREGGGNERVTEYLREVDAEISRNAPKYFEGNTVVDAVLHGKLNKARELGIDLQVSLNMDKDVSVDKMDLCSIFSNALDNAFEAQRGEEKGRYVKLNAQQRGSFLSIKVANPCAGRLKTDSSGNILSTKLGSGHGIGLKSVDRVAKKYNGKLDPKLENGIFTLSILLNI